jgi:hypothetical protein
MNTVIVAPISDPTAERWRQWQQANAQSSRTSAMRTRVVFTVVFTVVTGWLGWLLSSPLRA